MDALNLAPSRSQALVLCFSRRRDGSFEFDRQFKERAKCLARQIGLGHQWVVGQARYQTQRILTLGVVVSGRPSSVLGFARKAGTLRGHRALYRPDETSPWSYSPNRQDGAAPPSAPLKTLIESILSVREGQTELALSPEYSGEIGEVSLVTDPGFFESWRRSLSEKHRI